MNLLNSTRALAAFLILTLICCASTNALLKAQDQQAARHGPVTAGSTFHEDNVVVLGITRWEGLAVIRCQNRTSRAIEFEYRPRFLHKTGVELSAGEKQWIKASVPARTATNLNAPIPQSLAQLTDTIAIDVRKVRR